ncbi:MAG TPA: helix-turn-helix domain-containing protein [Candidatus Saccharimonadales bacterium]|nr:helix-turn-helix domain-containing protein [Candidatus Saccharimonadales bacterium]
MNKVLDFLEKLELSDLEAKLYLSLIESGPQTVRDLAKRAAIGRTTSYPYIDLLLEKGLIMKSVKGVHTYVIATSPEESLRHIVDQKTKTIQSIQKEFPEVISQLNSSVNTADIEGAEIKYYKGKTGIMKVYEDALKANELRSYIKLVEIQLAFPNNVFLFDEAFKINPKLQVKEILYDSSFARNEAKELAKNERYSYKFMPEGVKLTSEDILIYDGKVAIIHYRGESNSHTIVLQNIDYYNNSKELFEYMWKTLPEVSEKNS